MASLKKNSRCRKLLKLVHKTSGSPCARTNDITQRRSSRQSGLFLSTIAVNDDEDVMDVVCSLSGEFEANYVIKFTCNAVSFPSLLLTTVLIAANSSGRHLTFSQTYLPAQYLGSSALHSLLRHLL